MCSMPLCARTHVAARARARTRIRSLFSAEPFMLFHWFLSKHIENHNRLNGSGVVFCSGTAPTIGWPLNGLLLNETSAERLSPSLKLTDSSALIS